MRALSLTRPWPWAFFHAGKRIENRSWRPPRWMREAGVGTWVAMHAAQSFDDEALQRMQRGDFGDEAMEAVDSDADHRTGIVGAMMVTGAFELRTAHLDQQCLELSRSPWAFGPWCWVIGCVVEFREPIPCRGKLGLWELPSDLEPAVRAGIQTGRAAA